MLIKEENNMKISISLKKKTSMKERYKIAPVHERKRDVHFKVPCKACKKEMEYPFTLCKRCGWRPEGEFLEKASIFAKRYEQEQGIGPKEAKTIREGPIPTIAPPPPGTGTIHSQDTLSCPKCGGKVRIPSKERPVKFSCKNCGARIKIMD